MPASSNSGSSSSGEDESQSRESSPEPNNQQATQEGTEVLRPYQPPTESIIYEHGQLDPGEYDWDEVEKDDDIELIMIRVPAKLKASQLDGTNIKASRTSGKLEAKNRKYKLFSLNEAGVDHTLGGEEMKDFKVLLPRREDGGKLFLASKPISDYYVVSEAPKDSADGLDVPPVLPVKRFCYPAARLKHAFMPYGASQQSTSLETDVMDLNVDVIQTQPAKVHTSTPKKRKTDLSELGNSPEKEKKRRKKDKSDSPEKKKNIVSAPG